nr:hypothetical protein TorRG33x02_199050 [Ipomoea batatas]
MFVSTQNRHHHSHLHPALVLAPISLSQNPIHLPAQRLKLEAQIQMSETVFFSDPIIVDPRLLLRDGHHSSFDPEVPLHCNHHGVCVGGSRDGHARSCGGFPLGALAVGEEERVAVEGQVEAVVCVVPGGCVLGADEELVVVEEDPQGLHPCEVPLHAGVPSSDEVGVDVEIGIGDEAEVAVLLAVEVEGDPIAADESWVLAHRSWAASDTINLTGTSTQGVAPSATMKRRTTAMVVAESSRRAIGSLQVVDEEKMKTFVVCGYHQDLQALI